MPASSTASGRSRDARPARGDHGRRSPGARLLVADGHHRYAAYVALHGRDPASAHRSGLAMVIDQDETPLFLGAIHRLLHGAKLGDLLVGCVRRRSGR